MKLRYRIGTRVINFIWKVFFGWKVYGRENIPKNGGFIVASNHLSNFDPPLVGTAVWTRECYFFAKKELFEINKFFTWLIKAYNAFPADREKIDRNAIRKADEILKMGQGLIMFPEGTRSKTGELQTPKHGTAFIALRNKVPIVPALIKNSNTPLIKQFLRKKTVIVKFGKPITKEEVEKFSKSKDGRKKLSEIIMQKIKELDERITC